jgi:RHS repeat-associated protein
MTDAAKLAVWTAVWTPWGSPQSLTGTAMLDARFPGQWYQMEAGLAYNWHRSYDPSLGRYTQPDPLGFVDGPSVYGYARSAPVLLVDKDGRYSSLPWIPPSTTTVPAPLPGIPPSFPLPYIDPTPDSPNMPPIHDPEEPDRGKCRCRCRAGNPNDVSSYRFGEAQADSCVVAAVVSCKVAGERCTTAGGNVHHSKAKCTDGSYRSGSGAVTGSWAQY